ncbi:MotA/TolQ/ExbB proton channel [Methanobacterium lacus]|uniref:MotA/TolQ/ExbB proton channel n=1 Tax=Methanobacterium lacus (strain AL-21) TaxID=877455 RepID=F0T751_METLA|nr:MotA/TolQ/ExbB proton channel family protein [Methanobacterium lacus]ADZ10685.1 MotA/TolQ/ExbB proton channel [Methanobacterium lacus]
MVIASIENTFNSSLHIITQSFLIPVMAVLVIFFIYSLINLGILIAQYYKRKQKKFDFKHFIDQFLMESRNGNTAELSNIIESAKISRSHKEVLTTLLTTDNVSNEFRESLALKMVEDETINSAKNLEKTDIVAKIAPAIGLMGTLIPLGPGLTALGAGDIQSLAQHLTIAFDAAVLGMASAAIAFIVSKVRRRWYEEEISNLETLVDTVLEVMK